MDEKPSRYLVCGLTHKNEAYMQQGPTDPSRQPTARSVVIISWLFLLTTPLLAFAQSAFFEPLPDGSSPAQVRHSPLIITFDGTRPDDIARAWRPDSQPADEDEAADIRAASDPRVLDQLRQRLIPVATFASSQNLPECKRGGPIFSELMTHAEAALAVGAIGLARDSVERAKRSFACGAERVTREPMARFLLISGILRILSDQDDGGRLEDAVALAPNINPPEGSPDLVIKLMARAKLNQPRIARIPVRLETGDLAGLDLMIDGELRKGIQVKLQVGYHFIQLATPGGIARAGAIAKVENPAADGMAGIQSYVWPPQGVRPPSAVWMMTELERDVRHGELRPALARAVEGFREEKGYTWISFLAPTRSGGASQALWLYPGGASETAVLRPRREGRRDAIARSERRYGEVDSRGGLEEGRRMSAPTSDVEGTAEEPPRALEREDAYEISTARRSAEASSTEAPESSSPPSSRSAEEQKTQQGLEALAPELFDTNSPYMAPVNPPRETTLDLSEDPESPELVNSTSEKPKNRIAGAVTTGAFALGAVASGAVYFNARSRLRTETFPNFDEGETVRRQGILAGLSSVACLTGSLLSAGLTWLSPSAGGEAKANPHKKTQLNLIADRQAIGLQLGGTW